MACVYSLLQDRFDLALLQPLGLALAVPEEHTWPGPHPRSQGFPGHQAPCEGFTSLPSLSPFTPQPRRRLHCFLNSEMRKLRLRKFKPKATAGT